MLFSSKVPSSTSLKPPRGAAATSLTLDRRHSQPVHYTDSHDLPISNNSESTRSAFDFLSPAHSIDYRQLHLTIDISSSQSAPDQVFGTGLHRIRSLTKPHTCQSIQKTLHVKASLYTNVFHTTSLQFSSDFLRHYITMSGFSLLQLFDHYVYTP